MVARDNGTPSYDGHGNDGHDGHGIGGLDDADVADLWVRDPATGAYRMRTPDEVAEAAHESGAEAGPPDEVDDPRPEPAAPGPGRAARRAAPVRSGSTAKRRLKWTAISLAVLLLVAVGGAYGYYEYLNSRIDTDKRSGNDEVPAAPKDEQGRRQMNVLLIGSDSRIGAGNTGYGEDGKPGSADTVLLLHLSADRSNASVVSIPRDTLVDRPSCKSGNTTQPGAVRVKFNSTMAEPYGPPCTVATVERMLKVRIDHWLMIEFKGVKEMTKAVGGVPIVLCDRLYDPKGFKQGTGLDLKAGPHTLKGEDALRFLRARHGFAGESDLGRIEAQKQFLMALAREIKSSATWKDPAAILQIAQAATGNITVDEGLGRIEKLAGLGSEIKKVPEKRMAFTTLPVMDVPEENPKVNVLPMEPQAGQLWAAVRDDVPLTKGDPGAVAAPPPPPAAPAPPPPPVVDPGTVKVVVQNTTTVPKAQAVAGALKAKGYQASVDQTGGGKTARSNSSIVHPPGKADVARQLAAAVGLAETALDESTKAGDGFTIVIGLDFPGLADGASAKPSAGGKSPSKSASSSPPAAPVAGPAVTPPPAKDIKLDTADNKACIKTKYSKS